MDRNINQNIFIIVLIIIAIGLLLIYSAAYQYDSKTVFQNNYFLKQILWAVLSILILICVKNINYRRLFDSAFVLYAVSILLLVLLLIFGRSILGAKRWLELAGFNFQPSELAKLSVILVLGRYLSRRKAYGARFILRGSSGEVIRDLVIPLFIILVPMFLIFLQPDLGTAIIFIPIFLSMLFISKVKLKYLFSFIFISLGSLPVFWHFLRSYQKDRLLVFMNPNIDPLGAGYTIIQSKIAVGSGRLFGKGWLAGTQNQLHFLPERHTDFIFSVLGEEWGLFGGLILLVLFYLLIRNMIKLVAKTKDDFAKFIGVGIISLITFQIVVNISMTIGICPVVGLSLPFISYGGSSLCLFATFIGILLNISRKRMIF